MISLTGDKGVRVVKQLGRGPQLVWAGGLSYYHQRVGANGVGGEGINKHASSVLVHEQKNFKSINPGFLLGPL